MHAHLHELPRRLNSTTTWLTKIKTEIAAPPRKRIGKVGRKSPTGPTGAVLAMRPDHTLLLSPVATWTPICSPHAHSSAKKASLRAPAFMWPPYLDSWLRQEGGQGWSATGRAGGWMGCSFNACLFLFPSHMLASGHTHISHSTSCLPRPRMTNFPNPSVSK
jgi:hypothetical protein